MNEVQIFNNPDFGDIRTVERDGEPWFVGKDIALALGYQNTKDALRKHVDPEDKGGSQIATPSGIQQMTIINESGVYALIFSSKLETAQKFKRWVTSEVLPALRKTGAYLTPAAEAKLLGALDALAARVEALEGSRIATPLSLPAPLPPEGVQRDAPSRDYLKRWMRTASEKLALLGNRYNMGGPAILHTLYGYLEDDLGIVLEDERLRIMDEEGLETCSTLKAIFYEQEFRERLEELIDYNLAPENRGW